MSHSTGAAGSTSHAGIGNFLTETSPAKTGQLHTDDYKEVKSFLMTPLLIPGSANNVAIVIDGDSDDDSNHQDKSFTPPSTPSNSFSSSVPVLSLPLHQCNRCLKFLPNMKACNSCKHAHYCSVECQKADWPDHKTKCKQIKEEYSTIRQVYGEPSVNKCIQIVCSILSMKKKGKCFLIEIERPAEKRDHVIIFIRNGTMEELIQNDKLSFVEIDHISSMINNSAPEVPDNEFVAFFCHEHSTASYRFRYDDKIPNSINKETIWGCHEIIIHSVENTTTILTPDFTEIAVFQKKA